MTKFLWSAAMALVLLLTAGCMLRPDSLTGSSGSGSGGSSDVTSSVGASDQSGRPGLVGTTWLLEELYGEAVLDGSTPSATFYDGGEFGGSGGCNAYSGSYSTSGNELSIGDNLVSTQMACDELQQELDFFEALTNVATYDITDSVLTMYNQDNLVLAKFSSQSQDLVGTSWLIVSYNNGQDGVATVLQGTKATVEFGADGNISGNASCNRFSGSYTADAGDITIESLAITEMACPDPEGIMAQETQIVTALESAAAYHIEGSQLELRTADGQTAARLSWS